MKRIFVALLLLSNMCVLFLCCSDGPVSYGGSGTETVGGILVDTLGNPVVNALVLVAPIDTSSPLEYWDATNKEGKYFIENIKAGVYYLESYNQDSTLYIIDTFAYANDSVGLDLGVDTMRAPGSVSGWVFCDSVATAGVLVYIPGTSFDAHSDDSGKFVISFIPEGVYNVYYEYPGYLRGVDTNVSVFSGLTTALNLKNLTLDPNDKPPAPGFLDASYDTSSGSVILTWEEVNVSDLLGYNIYRRDTTDTGFIKISTTSTNAYSDTIFYDLSDTNSYFYQYQVTSVDTLTNESDFSPRTDINAISPTVLMTLFTWTLMPSDTDTVVNGQSVNLAVNFKNKSRKNILIRWYTGIPFEVVRTVNINIKEGNDTLNHMWQDTGAHLVCVEALDEKGDTWRDSCVVTVQGLVPTDTWEDFFHLLHARRFCGAAVIDSTLFAVGGAEDLFINMKWTPTALGSIESFTIGDSGWSSFTTMPTARYAAATVVVGKKMFVIGGMSYTQEYKSIEIYNYEQNGWESAVTMPSLHFNHAACVLNDSIYVFGGVIKSGGNYLVTDSIHIFDPASGSWSFKGTMSSPRANHQVVVVNNHIYIIGGQSDLASNPVSTVEKYNPVDNTTLPVKEMVNSRMYFGAAVLNGKIYVMGGYTTTSLSDFIAGVEAYDPSSDTWNSRKPLPKARHNMAVCVYNNNIYVIGGAENYHEDHLGQTSSVLKYYP